MKRYLTRLSEEQIETLLFAHTKQDIKRAFIDKLMDCADSFEANMLLKAHNDKYKLSKRTFYLYEKAIKYMEK